MIFSSPWVNYRYKRLPFGVVNSQDLFDSEMAKILSGNPKTLNNHDDIMIGRVDLVDHNKNLKMVFKRLKDHNLTLRQEKCEFRKSTLEFHGHLFTAQVLNPSASKIRAVNALQRPNTKEELISFLQMVAYLSRYMGRFSSRCEPLTRLTKANIKFVWGPDQQKAFDDMKSTLTTAPVLISYQPGRETMVIVQGRSSTSIIPVTQKLKKIFSTHGVLRVQQTDNGPPINGEQFQAFAHEMGFKQKRVTPVHGSKSQGELQ